MLWSSTFGCAAYVQDFAYDSGSSISGALAICRGDSQIGALAFRGLLFFEASAAAFPSIA